VTVWSRRDPDQTPIRPAWPKLVRALALSPSGTRVAVGRNDGTTLWSLNAELPVVPIPPRGGATGPM
jgi:hypothetical protein